MSHTPGPWSLAGEPHRAHSTKGTELDWSRIQSAHVVGPQHQRVAVMSLARESTEEIRANARLIAQAPAMLALIRWFAESVYAVKSSRLEEARAILRAVEGE